MKNNLVYLYKNMWGDYEKYNYFLSYFYIYCIYYQL